MMHSAKELCCNLDARLGKISVQSVLSLIGLKLQQSLALKFAITAPWFIRYTYLEEAVTDWPFNFNNCAIVIDHTLNYVL
jgi:hypothetical protein